jgi:hypothetical protein
MTSPAAAAAQVEKCKSRRKEADKKRDKKNPSLV